MRIVFIGTGEIGVPVLQRLRQPGEHQLVGVVTQPDKPAGRDQRLRPSPIKCVLENEAIPLVQPKRIKDPKTIAYLRSLAPDVIVVMAYGQILPREVLEIPRIACLNLHASLLPRHRGAAPLQAAIVAGDSETGITVMYMDAGLDTGDILLQRQIRIAPAETGGSLHDRLAQVAPGVLDEALRHVGAGTALRIPQDSSLATYAPKLEREHGKINWSEPAELIERKIRAFDPWPSAFITLTNRSGQSRILKIFNAAVVTEKKGAPGDIFFSDDAGLGVASEDAAVSLGEVQLEGKRRMSAAQFLRGHSWVKDARIN